jgi:hypothetical protein
VRNIKRNSHVSVLIDTTEVPFKGALIYGRAELDYEDVIPERVAIFEKRLTQKPSQDLRHSVGKQVEVRNPADHANSNRIVRLLESVGRPPSIGQTG